MATLVYKSVIFPQCANQKIYLLTSITEDGSNDLKFNICEKEAVFLTLGDKRYRLTDGSVSVKASELGDGYTAPKITEGTKIFSASALFKNGKELKSAFPSGEESLQINELLYSLTLRLSNALSRIKNLEEKIEPRELFIFTNERTTK